MPAHGFTQGFNFNFTKLAPWLSWMNYQVTEKGIRFVLPGTADVNHIDGIGTIYLVAHLPIGAIGSIKSLDLRNAKIELTIKASNLDLHQGKLVWWIVSDIPKIETNRNFAWQQTNWAYTGKTFNESSLPNGAWSTVSVTLDPSPVKWTYAATNTSLHGSWGNRYVRYPITKALKDVNATLHFVIIGAKKPPQGTIEISNIKLQTTRPPHMPNYDDLYQLVMDKQWKEAAPGLKLLADNGHAQAAFYYANILKHRLLGKVNVLSAKAYYEEAEHDVIEASVELANKTINTIYNPQNYISSLILTLKQEVVEKINYVIIQLPAVLVETKKMLQKITSRSNVKTDTTIVSYMPNFEDLLQLWKDNKWDKAAPGLKLLADNGHSEAAFYYANILNYGLIGKVDACLARNYYEKAEHNIIEASVELASQDIKALCNPRNYLNALKRLVRAQSIPRARYYKAMILLYYFRDKTDINTIMNDLYYAANNGFVDAMGELGLLNMSNGNNTEALYWFNLAKQKALPSDPRKKYFFSTAYNELKKLG